MTLSLDAQVAALGIAFIELAKHLGREQCITVTQLTVALANTAEVSKANAETTTAVSELGRSLR